LGADLGAGAFEEALEEEVLEEDELSLLPPPPADAIPAMTMMATNPRQPNFSTPLFFFGGWGCG
jgi:hypothetical protein